MDPPRNLIGLFQTTNQLRKAQKIKIPTLGGSPGPRGGPRPRPQYWSQTGIPSPAPATKNAADSVRNLRQNAGDSWGLPSGKPTKNYGK